jgi:phosphatidyl-myo-inositol dimannoside synthase
MATYTASSVLDDPARPSGRAPMLAAITMARGGDGVAVVANLLWRAFERRWPDARLVTMFDGRARTPGLSDKAGFTATLMAELAAQRPAAIVYSHLGLARAQAYVPSILERPYAVFLHGVEAWGALGDADLRLLQRARLRLANSHFTAARVLQEHPSIGEIVACPLALVEDGRSTTSQNGSETIEVLPHDGPIVLAVGRMHVSEAYKGHDQLIEAWPSVVSRVPTANLVIVGDGTDRPRLENKARLVEGAHRIHFLGFASAALLDACYDRAAVFALPSRGEGFGLVYLEAMARALPCIASRQDAASEVIVGGVTGHLVDHTDTTALSARMVQLLTNERERQAMGEAGRTRLMTEFSEAAFGARLIAALEAAFDDTLR